MPDSPPSCDICGGSGWITRAGSLRAEPCVCQADLKRKQRIAASRIPKRYLHCQLSGFHDRSEVSLGAAKRRVADFIDCWPADDRGLLLMGGSGVGKTHLAVATIVEIIDQDKPGKLLFRNFQELVQDIQFSFDSSDAPKKAEILQPLIDADLLVLDELGSQKPTPFVQDILYYIINSRYNDVKATIFTTNYLDEPRAPGEERLEDRIGARLRSRLFEMAHPVLITARDDYRKSLGRSV
ncbi:MAG: ATP-binding protein [Thermoanaerobaculia bacterium]